MDQPGMDHTGATLMSRALEITNNNKKRRDAQRKTLVIAHEKHVKAASEKTRLLFGESKSRVMKSHRDAWQRLNNLNKRREELEAQILASMKTIELETEVMRHEMGAILEGRIHDIKHPEELDI